MGKRVAFHTVFGFIGFAIGFLGVSIFYAGSTMIQQPSWPSYLVGLVLMGFPFVLTAAFIISLVESKFKQSSKESE